jgi:hypothetical protein
MERRARKLTAGCGMVVALVAGWWLSTARGQEGNVPSLPPQLQAGPTQGCLQVVAQPGEPVVAIVYDPQDKVMGVYHIDREGGITLKGIRPLRWDLQMLHFNGKAPLPEDVRNGLTR